MRITRHNTIVPAAAAVAAILAASPAVKAENMTAETTKLLKAINKSPAILKGLDEELKVPQAWIDGAKKEGSVKLRTTVQAPRFAKAWKIFHARYPFLEYTYVRGIGPERARKPLMAYAMQKTILSDVVSSFEVMEGQYRDANALIDLRGLPGVKNVPAQFTAADGISTSYRKQHYCMSYNPATVKKSDLPKTWDDIITNPRWHNGKIGMAVNIHVWLAPIWGIKGDKWTYDYLDKLFSVVKPQLRKERLSMTPQLNAMGEFDASIPAGDFIVKVTERKGMKIGFHCPEPVPTTAAHIGIMKGSPRENAAKLFVNWILSKEGQLAMHYADAQIPVHKDLTDPSFNPYPDAVVGKQIAWGDERVLKKMPDIVRRFQKLWVAGGGGGKKGGPR